LFREATKQENKCHKIKTNVILLADRTVTLLV